MGNSIPNVPLPPNERVRSYAPGSPERAELKAKLDELAANPLEVPLFINGEEVRTGDTIELKVPHDHSLTLGVAHKASAVHVQQAIEAASAAKAEWAALPWEQRAAVFLRVGELLAGPWRDVLNASTMLNQSKTVNQAEIDAACEAIDFMRFNVYYATRLYAEQPESPISSAGIWNRLEHRPLDGFVFAVSPFNFTSIAANLPSAPAMLA